MGETRERAESKAAAKAAALGRWKAAEELYNKTGRERWLDASDEAAADFIALGGDPSLVGYQS